MIDNSKKMAKGKDTYTLPTDSQTTMASEPVVAYASQSLQEHIVLTVPRGLDAEPLRQKVNAYYETLLKDVMREQMLRNALDKWLDHTGFYSGPNLCWDNEYFHQIQSMGAEVLSMVDEAFVSYPEYTHRHLGWLKRKLQEVCTARCIVI